MGDEMERRFMVAKAANAALEAELSAVRAENVRLHAALTDLRQWAQSSIDDPLSDSSLWSVPVIDRIDAALAAAAE